MNWRVKGVIQKCLGGLPGGVRVNDFLQRTLGGLRDFPGHLAEKVDDWAILMSHMRELGVDPRDKHYFEVGTGWFPTLPVCYALAGASEVTTFDLSRHLDPGLTFRMVRELRSLLPKISDAGPRPASEVAAAHERLSGVNALDDLLAQARITYSAPADASQSGIADASVDVVFSNSVLEHVPPGVIIALMAEARRILKPGGLMIHSLNCGDHYAYFDRGITFMNYLRYTGREWRFWDNALLYQNRLRPSDFIAMSENAGLTTVLRKQRPRPEYLAMLPEFPLAPEFSRYSPEDLCSTSLDFVARKD